MSIDYEVAIVYGKEFASFSDALDELLSLGLLSDSEYDDARSCGELDEYDWKLYNGFSGGAGVLGYETSALAIFLDHTYAATRFECIDELLGGGCELFEFVSIT